MADLLGSLLPAEYAAPNVQDVLGGELEAGASCKKNGTTPTCTKPTSCGLYGGTPGG